MNGEGISIPLEVVDRFSAVFARFEAAGAKALSAAREHLSKVGLSAETSGRQFGTLAKSTDDALTEVGTAAREAGSYLERFADSAVTAGQRSGDAWKLFANALQDSLDLALDLFDDFWGGVGSLVESGVSALLSQVPVIGAALAAAAPSIVNWIADAFSGPDNEELLRRQGSAMGAIWGAAFSETVEKVLADVAAKLPKAGSGKFDVVFASYHPDTLRAIMDELSSFGVEAQRKLAEAMGHGVNYLRDKLGITHADAFRMMAPAFEQAIDLALRFGEKLDPQIVALIEHAKNLGVELEVDAQKFTDALEGFIGKADISVAALRNLRELAGQVGVDIDAAFAAAMERFIETEDRSIAKLEEIARAAAEAGYDVDAALNGALVSAEAKLAGLQGDLEEFGLRTLRWFQDKFRLRDERRDFRAEFMDEAGESARRNFNHQQQARLQEIRGIRDADARAAAEAAYNAEREAVAVAAQIVAQERYVELKEKARRLDLDGVNDRREIRALMAGMTEDEKKTFLALIEQKQERKAHKKALEEQKDEEERVRAAIAAQEALVRSINDLIGTIASKFSNLGNNIPVDSTEDFAGALHRAYLDWKYMAEHPIGSPGGPVGFSGAGGFDYLLNGPAGGYTVPVTLHGTERLIAQPASATASGGATVIIQPQVTINALDTRSLHERGADIANAVAAATRRGLTHLDPRVVRGG